VKNNKIILISIILLNYKK